MNFLPFVFTFLLVLTLISSFLFSSVMGTARESHLILLQHKAYITLLSEKNKKLFKPMKKKKGDKEKTQKPGKVAKEKPEPRSDGSGCDQSKLNVFVMIHGNDSEFQHLLEQTAVRLIEMLYGSYDFYKSATVKDIAHTIVRQMKNKPFESFDELQFENPEINQIYYKMLRGTSSGYPSLCEYFHYENMQHPIYFPYASKPVMRAALGEKFASVVFEQEKKPRGKNNRPKVMLKKDFTDLLKNHHDSLVPFDRMDQVFNFKNDAKGTPQTRREKQVRAVYRS